MGLFRKKNSDAEHLRMMQEQMVALRERLDQSDAAKAELEERIGRLDAENQRLSGQVGDVEVQVVTVQSKVGTVEAQVGEVASKVGTVEGHIGTVATSIGQVATKVGTVESQVAGVAQHVDDVETKVGTVATHVGTVATRVGDVGALRGDIERLTSANAESPDVDEIERRLTAQVESLAATVEEQRLHLADLALVATDTAEKAAAGAFDPADVEPVVDEELRTQVGLIAEKMTALDGRVTQISVELTNQLTELGRELDAVQEQGGDTAAIDDKLTAIASGQERLANEQARYEIQFRKDLAELVDRFRRPGAS